MAFRLGIDVGGTFTDFVLLDDSGGRIWTHKYLTTPHDPVQGIMAGLYALLERAHLRVADVSDAHIVHGTTLVTNALIERKGCKVALITSRGARDVLETGKENRYDPYDRHIRRPPPLVERRLRREVDERIRPDGSVERPLDLEQVAEILDELQREGVDVLAVCLLHAYRNPEHEQQIGALAAKRGLTVSLSSVVSPEIGEYERVSTTVANAYVQPFTARYVTRLQGALRAAGFTRGFHMMLSDGGIAAPEAVARVPIRILESGPAAGALAACLYGKTLGLDHLIAFDMGGTTAKISVIHNAEPARTGIFEVGRADRTKRGSGIPVRVPTVEMLEIGAGGGSLARLDGMGLLKVGPHSAGADPGPACYGRAHPSGGHPGGEPTVTDANLLLGYLADGAQLGENLRLSREPADRAVAPLAAALGTDTATAAEGIHRVVTEAMAHVVKLHATERGGDPRAFTLFAFGGAGPLHACAIAQQLGLSRVIIPAGAGVLSAFGFIAAPPAVALTHTFLASLERLDRARLGELAEALGGEAVAMLGRAGLRPEQISLQFTLSMRYQGQGYDVDVPLAPGPVGEVDTAALLRRFEDTYRALYGAHLTGPAVEVRSLKLWASGPAPEVRLPMAPAGGDSRPVARRTARFPGSGEVECPVYDRTRLNPGAAISGPALVEDPHTTAVIPPGATCTMDPYGNLLVDVPAQATWRPSAGDLGPVDLEILLARLRSIMDECDRTILRTAFSAIVRDGKDYAVVLTDPLGNSLALPTETMPLFVTCMPRSIGILVQDFPPASLRPGDVIVTNDPWIVAGHKHDIMLMMPVFKHGQVVAFVGAVSHLPDVGEVMGGFRAWDLVEEGFYIPPMKLYESGKLNETLSTLLRCNVRQPLEVMGDVGALMGACRVGGARLLEFLEDTGLDDLNQLSAAIGRRAQAAFREAAAKIPYGTYRYTFVADGIVPSHAAPDTPIEIAATLTSSPAGLAVDFTGTSPQLPHFPINVPIPYTLADTIYALQYLLTPSLSNVGPSYNPVQISAPEGCILAATPPAPVRSRTRTGVHITTALCGALVQAVPDLAMAGCGHNVIIRIAGVRTDGSYFGVTVMPKGGMGASRDEDGWNVTVYPTNCSMLPTEGLEAMSPVSMDREILCDSGGPGRRRGGTGQRVTIRSRSENPITVSVTLNFVYHPAPGFLGGLAGSRVRTLVNGAPATQNPITLHRGDVLVIETAGGGGLGDPAEREPERVLEDVRQGYVSLQAARDVYRVGIDPATMTLDPAATTALRSPTAVTDFRNLCYHYSVTR